MKHSEVYSRNRKDLGGVVISKKDKALTVEQVRKRLNCSKSHVNNMINEGKLKAFKIGTIRGRRVYVSEVENYKENQMKKFGGVEDDI